MLENKPLSVHVSQDLDTLSLNDCKEIYLKQMINHPSTQKLKGLNVGLRVSKDLLGLMFVEIHF